MKLKRCPKCGSQKRTVEDGATTCTACNFVEFEKTKSIVND